MRDRLLGKFVSEDWVSYTNTNKHDVTTTKTYRKTLRVVPSCSYRRALKLMSNWWQKGGKRKGHPKWTSKVGNDRANYNRRRRTLWILTVECVSTVSQGGSL